MVTVRVLLADDHALMLAGERQALEAGEGFEIVGEAQRGPEVLPLVGRTAPDVVLLDIRMPGVDGLDCLQRIRERHPDVKVVMCSMSSDPDKIQSAFRLGACGYILKTINPIDLASAIRQAVDGTAFHALGLPAMSEQTAGRGRRPDRSRVRDREGTVSRSLQQGDRGGALDHRADGEVPPDEHLSQARHQ